MDYLYVVRFIREGINTISNNGNASLKKMKEKMEHVINES